MSMRIVRTSVLLPHPLTDSIELNLTFSIGKAAMEYTNFYRIGRKKGLYRVRDGPLKVSSPASITFLKHF